MISFIILVYLTGPDNQQIEVNPQQVVSIRPPRKNEHFAHGTQCLINTTDGKFIAVQETCAHVREQLGK